MHMVSAISVYYGGDRVVELLTSQQTGEGRRGGEKEGSRKENRQGLPFMSPCCSFHSW